MIISSYLLSTYVWSTGEMALLKLIHHIFTDAQQGNYYYYDFFLEPGEQMVQDVQQLTQILHR